MKPGWRTSAAPPALGPEPDPVHHLHRAIGNRAVRRLLEERLSRAHPDASSAARQRLEPEPVARRFGQGRDQVHAESQPPVRQPPAPEPKKGDKPLGTLKDKQTGAGKGAFDVKVTKGSDKVALAGGGATLTGKDLTKVGVGTLAPSTRHDDVTIEVNHRAPGATADTTMEAKLEVRAPHHLDLLGTDHVADGPHGFKSWTSLRVFDNFGEPMPYIDVNEDFSAATFEKGVSSEWKDAFAARNKGQDVSRSNAVFKDQYGVASSGPPPAGMTPAVSNPKKPLGRTRVGSFSHDWYVGSPTTGKGVHVSRHRGMFYADHAEYTRFVSPPPQAKAPRGTKTRRK